MRYREARYLKKTAAYFVKRPGKVSRIRDARHGYRSEGFTKMMAVQPSGFYAWRGEQES